MKKYLITLLTLLLLVACSQGSQELRCEGEVAAIKEAKIETVFRGSKKEIKSYYSLQTIPLNTLSLDKKAQKAYEEELRELYQEAQDEMLSFDLKIKDNILTLELELKDISKATDQELEAAGLNLKNGQGIYDFELTKEQQEARNMTCKYKEE